MPDAVLGGRYRLLERLAAGGMGSVWKAWDERLQRVVAVKQLHLQPGLSPHDAHVAAERAMREARNAARLHHPNAVHVFDVVDDNGRPCLVMQYVPSTSLQQIVRTQGPRPVAEVARIGTQVAAALAAAHRAGIVHRDVKPGNILIAEDGTAKITDFGISHAHDDPALTSTGMLTGTPAYLAPEVARGAPTTPASDVFSLASTLFMAAEGSPPFGTDQNAMAVLDRVASGNTTPATRLGALEPVLRAMMSPDPSLRPGMVEVANLLGTVSTGGGAATAARVAPALAAAATQAIPRQYHDPPRRQPMVVRAPVSPPPRRERQLSFVLPFLAASLVVVLGAVLAIVLIRHSTQSAPRSAGAQQSNGAGATPVVRTTSTSPPTRSSTQPASNVTTRSSSTKPAPPGPPARPSTSPTPRSTSPTPPQVATAQQLAQAITDYYSLVPGNTDAGWQKLTDRYRRTTAQGRDKYEQFWATIRRVSVSNLVVALPGTVVATLTYYPQHGPKAVNRTEFAVIDDRGTLKIDGSQVL